MISVEFPEKWMAAYTKKNQPFEDIKFKDRVKEKYWDSVYGDRKNRLVFIGLKEKMNVEQIKKD